jgi:hypothetical protein
MMIVAITFLELFAQTGLADPNKFNHFMILGYIVMWIIAMVYILSLANRQRNVKEEVELLRQLLEEDEEATSG